MSEARHFYEINKADSTDACKLALSNCGLLQEDVLSWSSLRRMLGLYTLVYRSNSDSLIDLHPDFVKGATSEQALFTGIKLKLPLYTHTALASQASAKAKAKAFAQVTSRHAQTSGLYNTPARLRMQFKADMVDETSAIDSSVSCLQPFGAPRSHVDVPAAAPTTPVDCIRKRSPSPVEELVEDDLDPNALQCVRCGFFCTNLSVGTIRIFSDKEFFCGAIGKACSRPKFQRRVPKIVRK